MKNISNIRAVFNESPLAKRHDKNLTESHVAKTLKGVNGDHASDFKKQHSYLSDWKLRHAQVSLGLAELYEQMSTDQLIDAIVPEWVAKVESLGGLAAWSRLSPEAQIQHQRDVERAAALRIGKEKYTNLSDLEKREYEVCFRGGCCMHKDLNAFKGGSVALAAFWALAGLVPPILLANKENAALLADADAAATEAGRAALESSSRGAAKACALGGSICKHSDSKKGQQEIFTMFTQSVLGYKLAFPDTSNTRYGSYGDASTIIVTHLPVFQSFMEFVRDKKEKPGLTNLELNFYNAIRDVPTLIELCVFAVYSQVISHPYMVGVRQKDGNGVPLNIMDLGPFHVKLLDHIQALADAPELVLSSMEESSLDSKQWDNPELYYCVVALVWKFPGRVFLDAFHTFLIGSLRTWERFVEDYVDGGVIAQASAEERRKAYMPATNDQNEGALGSKRVYARSHVKHSDIMFNSIKMFTENKTGEWMDRNFVEEDFVYVRKIARDLDQQRLQEKSNLEISQNHQRVAEEHRVKAAQKQAAEQVLRNKYSVPLLCNESLVEGFKLVKEFEFHLKVYRRAFKTHGIGSVPVPFKTNLKNNTQRKDALLAAISQYKASKFYPTLSQPASQPQVTSDTPPTVISNDHGESDDET